MFGELPPAQLITFVILVWVISEGFTIVRTQVRPPHWGCLGDNSECVHVDEGRLGAT